MTIRSRSRKLAYQADLLRKQLANIVEHRDINHPDPRNWDDKPQKTHDEIMANIARRSVK